MNLNVDITLKGDDIEYYLRHNIDNMLEYDEFYKRKSLIEISCGSLTNHQEIEELKSLFDKILKRQTHLVDISYLTPKICEIYTIFASNKVKESCKYKVKVTDIVTLSNLEKEILDIWNETLLGKNTNFDISNETFVISQADIGDGNGFNYLEVFARQKNGEWYSFIGLASLLDIDSFYGGWLNSTGDIYDTNNEKMD